MPAALGPRFVLEAGFLILLAVVVGLADLRPALIILVMAVGWVLVAMIEYFAWRQSPRVSMVGRYSGPVAEAPRREVVDEEVVEEHPPPAPSPESPPATPPPAEEETMIASPTEPAETKEAIAFRQAEESRARYSLEPLRPRPRRRWILFGPRDRSEQAEGSSEEER